MMKLARAKGQNMQNRNPFLDDMSKLAGDMLGLAKGMRDEVDQMIKAKFDEYLAAEGLVSREDVSVLHARIDVLEQKLAEFESRLADSQQSDVSPNKSTD